MIEIESSLFLAGKLFAILAFSIYVAFAVVVLRQVYLMVKTVKFGFELPLQVVAWVHAVFAVLVLIFVLLYL